MKNIGESFYRQDELEIDSLKSIAKEKREELEAKIREYDKSDKYTNKTDKDASQKELIALEKELMDTEGKIKELEDLQNKGQYSETFMEKQRKEKAAIEATEEGKETKEETVVEKTPEELEEETKKAEEAKRIEEEKALEEKRVETEKVKNRVETDEKTAERIKRQMEIDAEYYKILKESTEKIGGCQNFEELYKTLEQISGLHGSEDYFPSELLVKIIKEIDSLDPLNENTQFALLKVTRTAGLRFKVQELLSKKVEKILDESSPEELVKENEAVDNSLAIIPRPNFEITKVEKLEPAPVPESIPDQEKDPDQEKEIDFEDLSPGQQAFVMDKLENLKLSKSLEMAERNVENKIKNSGFFKKIVLNTFKRFNVGKEEKKLVDQENQESAVSEAEFKEICKIASEMEIEMLEGGNYRINYLKSNGEPKIDDQNQVLTNWSRTPKEWQFESATPEQKKDYEKAKQEYDQIRCDIINDFAKTGTQEMALKEFSLIEQQLELNKFMSENPDALNLLKKIKKQNNWGRMLKDFMNDIKTERGAYLLLGSASRMLLGSFGLFAVPVAGVIGGFAERARAKETLKSETKKTRRNYEGNETVEKNNEKSNELSSKLELLIKQIEENKDNPDKVKDLLDKLKTRAEYTKEKIEKDLVNYGGPESRLGNQYRLFKTIASSEILLINQKDNPDRQKVEKRLEKMMLGLSQKFDKDKKRYLMDRTIRGGAVAGAFALVGYLISCCCQGPQKIIERGEVIPPIPPSIPDPTYKVFENIIDDQVAKASGRVKYDSVWHSLWETVSQNKEAFGLPPNATPEKINAFVHKVWLDSPGLDSGGPGMGALVQNGDKVFAKINTDGSVVAGILRNK